MKKLIVLAIVFTGLATAARADVCEDLSSSVERSLKVVALLNKLSISLAGRGNSSIEQVENKISIGNEWQRININIQLMAQNKCTPLTDATSYSRFIQ